MTGRTRALSLRGGQQFDFDLVEDDEAALHELKKEVRMLRVSYVCHWFHVVGLFASVQMLMSACS